MSRLNLTLDEATMRAIEERAERAGRSRAAVARALIREGLDRRERRERYSRLARDYAAARDDDAELLAEIESAQSELLADAP